MSVDKFENEDVLALLAEFFGRLSKPLLQAGGHGTCICQCQSAKIVTRKTIPMQVDGEACRVKPSIIHLSVLNKAHVVTKRRGRTSHPDGECLQPAEKHTQDDAAVWVPQSNGSGGCVVCRRRGSEQTPSPSAPLGGRTARPPFCKICERSNSDSAVFRSMRDQRRRMQLESDTASELDVCDSDGDVLDHRPHPPPSGTTSTTPTTTTTSSSSSSSVLVAQMTPPAHSTPLPSPPPPPPPPAPASPVSPPQPPAGGGGDERRSQTP
ncbi:unnamed protein product [Notodromas monacha]|uniref:Uncharacterized protein n=1 Tax=Notodromas monacha TaxID=399045 RepID=A0A7R9BV46_9CRUS|nr:unnamed protein product [Notodromas monacha]CAG0922316.1 unnamed protein product [Notodromas monacha]